MKNILTKSSMKGDYILDKQDQEFQGLVERLYEMLQTLAYGSITIIVQDGKVVQIDKHEKMRIRGR